MRCRLRPRQRICDPGERRDLAPLTAPERMTGATNGDEHVGLISNSPRHVVGRAVGIGIEMAHAFNESNEPRRGGRVTEFDADRGVAEATDDDPLGPKQVVQGCRQRDQRVTRGFGERGGGFEAVKVAVDTGPLYKVHVFHIDTINFTDFGDQQIDQTRLGKLHREIVDGAATTGFENFDANYITAERADSARYLAKGTRTIREPDTDDVRFHVVHSREELRRSCVGFVNSK
jgi:hypothetical protein